MLATAASAIIGVGLIAAALWWRLGGDEPDARGGNREVTRAELAHADGRHGRTCLVAVDGTVYRIEGFFLWRGGEHVPSGGRARCGRDLSAVIRQAPHGRTKLRLLPKVGKLQ